MLPSDAGGSRTLTKVVTIPCGKERHQVGIDHKGHLVALDHGPYRRSMVLHALAGEKIPACLKLIQAWSNRDKIVNYRPNKLCAGTWGIDADYELRLWLNEESEKHRHKQLRLLSQFDDPLTEPTLRERLVAITKRELDAQIRKLVLEDRSYKFCETYLEVEQSEFVVMLSGNYPYIYISAESQTVIINASVPLMWLLMHRQKKARIGKWLILGQIPTPTDSKDTESDVYLALTNSTKLGLSCHYVRVTNGKVQSIEEAPKLWKSCGGWGISSTLNRSSVLYGRSEPGQGQADSSNRRD